VLDAGIEQLLDGLRKEDTTPTPIPSPPNNA
jgi:hypothetical protein